MSQNNITYICSPDHSLRDLIGRNVDLKDVFSADIIQSCQDLVIAAQETFFPKAQLEISNIKQLYQTITAGDDVEDTLQTIRERVLNIQGLASLFGYDLVRQICASLTESQSIFQAQTSLSEKDMMLIKSLIDLLDLTCKSKISGDNPHIQEELFRVLAMAQRPRKA
ncbi:MAG: hypothetical protein AAB276_00335 [Pseudomonadota bacterium]